MEIGRRAVVPVDDAGPVFHVADERMIDVAQVTPDLMEPPRLGDGLDQGAPVDRGSPDAPEARDRRHAWSTFLLLDGMIDDPGLGWYAADEGKVTFLDLALLEGLGEARRGVAIARERQGAAGAAIESVHGVHVLAQRVADAEESDVVVVVPTAMHEQPRGLVDHHHVRIDVEPFGSG